MISIRLINRYLIASIVILVTLEVSCTTSKEKSEIENKPKYIANIESFDEFYRKFHYDSSFQISRIKFPLKGYNIGNNYNPDEDLDSNFYWNRKEWRIHRSITDTSFKIDRKKNDSIVEETTFIPNTGFEIIRKFQLKEGKWYLTFYGSQNL